jgi:Na+-translocating ferredoxin:NAD+ oxidoreductase subunit G
MKQKEIIKLGLILFFITAMTGLILGGVYGITKAPIEKQIVKEKEAAMGKVLKAADRFKMLKVTNRDGIVKEINVGMNKNEVIGYAIKVEAKGYGGPLEIMVGIGSGGKVEGIEILAQHETPGLGANAVLPAFSGQYNGKSINKELEVVKTAISSPNEIEAMTGATITSRAVTLGVNEAIKAYKEIIKGGQK